MVEQSAHVALARERIAGGRIAVGFDRPALGRQDSGDHAQGGGLARAVGAQESGDGSRCGVEREVLDDGAAVKAFFEGVYLNHSASMDRMPASGRRNHPDEGRF